MIDRNKYTTIRFQNIPQFPILCIYVHLATLTKSPFASSDFSHPSSHLYPSHIVFINLYFLELFPKIFIEVFLLIAITYKFWKYYIYNIPSIKKKKYIGVKNSRHFQTNKSLTSWSRHSIFHTLPCTLLIYFIPPPKPH